jgi:hypothetical protein
MLLTSQNRVSVFQASVANVRDVVLAAAVAHRSPTSKRRCSGMRRTCRPEGITMRADLIGSDHRPGADRQPPAGYEMGLTLHPRLWASLVLSRMSRG